MRHDCSFVLESKRGITLDACREAERAAQAFESVRPVLGRRAGSHTDQEQK